MGGLLTKSLDAHKQAGTILVEIVNAINSLNIAGLNLAAGVTNSALTGIISKIRWVSRSVPPELLECAAAPSTMQPAGSTGLTRAHLVLTAVFCPVCAYLQKQPGTTAPQNAQSPCLLTIQAAFSYYLLPCTASSPLTPPPPQD